MHARTTWLAHTLLAALAAPAAGQITPGTEPGTFKGPTVRRRPMWSVHRWLERPLSSLRDAAKDDGYVMVGIPDYRRGPRPIQRRTAVARTTT
jgi:hypothetical protein